MTFALLRRPSVAAAMMLGVAGALGARARALSAQIAIKIPMLTGDSISPAPLISVQAAPLPDVQASTITLEMAFDNFFNPPFLILSTTGSAGTFQMRQLLAPRTRVYFRARIRDAGGTVRAETTANHPVQSWLRLLSPVGATNNVLPTRQPTFTWASPVITLLPPGPWFYTFDIINTGSGTVEQERMGSDTTFVTVAPLDACTSYYWRVKAQAVNGAPTDTVTVRTPGTFVIQTPDCPNATFFYHNFPNPFGGSPSSAVTCFWFFLARSSMVTLTIYDIQLRQVRHVVPGPLTTAGAILQPGWYGPQKDTTQKGCDQRLQWDGRDDGGRIVPPGVYIASFTGDGVHTTHKILFKGP